MKSVCDRWRLESIVDLLFSFGNKLIQLAIFIPLFLTAGSVAAESVYVTVVCAALLHDRCLRLGTYTISYLFRASITIKRIVVSLYRTNAQNCIQSKIQCKMIAMKAMRA